MEGPGARQADRGPCRPCIPPCAIVYHASPAAFPCARGSATLFSFLWLACGALALVLRQPSHACQPGPRSPAHRPPALPPASLPAGLQRQVVYGGLRIGLYEPIRNAMVGRDHVGDVSLGIKIAAGLTTGAIGIAVASPTDLVKVCVCVLTSETDVPTRVAGFLETA